MNVSEDVAAERARDVRDGIIRLSSPVRGLGSVLVGPDLSVLFYASYIGSEEALMEWDKGTRTPRESFNALHTLKDGTRRPQDER